MTTNKQDDKIREIDYDGIKECDNDLPRWWLWSFYITIVFAVIYMGYYHFGGPGKSAVAQFEESMQNDKVMAAAAAPSSGDLYDETKLQALRGDKTMLAKGAETFKAKCAVCHGPKGEGNIGPNFTDNYWIHGGKLSQITKTIHDGVPEKGMVAWGALMSNDEIIAAAVYIKSLKGTNPPNPKAPQGVLENE